MTPDFASYKRIIVAFSGGKDSLACVLHLIDLGVSTWEPHRPQRPAVGGDARGGPRGARDRPAGVGLRCGLIGEGDRYYSFAEGGGGGGTMAMNAPRPGPELDE